MASKADIDATYNYMDALWRLSMGESADITCALYDGNYSKTLEQAQNDKHEFILQQMGFRSGFRILDIGCGWGGFLKTVTLRGGEGVGITLATKQAESCRRMGLDVRVRDWKSIGREEFGSFDAIVCVGAFEHFCSEEEYAAGKQDSIYRGFFQLCHGLLRPQRRLFVQTMTWGCRAASPATISLRAPKGSDEYILAVLRKFYPGSWLPLGVSHISLTSGPWFRVMFTSCGRHDYIETMTQWDERLRRFRFAKLTAVLPLLRSVFTDRDFTYRLEALRGSYNRECFRRGLMDHYRVVLERCESRHVGRAARAAGW